MKIPLDELVIKAGELALREIGQAPEFRAARKLRDSVTALAPPIEADAPKVVFFTPRSWASHVQWEGVMGQALRLRGADVSFLGCAGGLGICDRDNLYEAPPMPCHTCTGYVRHGIEAHGFPREELRYDEGAEAAWPELDAMSVDELYAVEHRGVPLGQLTVIPSQWFDMSTLVHEDPLAPVNIRRFLRAGRLVIDALDEWFDTNRPDVMVLLNGLFFFEGICWEMAQARGIDVVTYERGFVKGRLIFRRNSCACHFDHSDWWDAWSARDLEPAEDQELTEFLDARRTGGSSIDTYWDAAEFSGVERTRTGSLAVMFTNLTWDSAVIGKELAFPTIHDWIATAIDVFRERPDDELLIRVHPAELKLRGKQTREPIVEVLARRGIELPPNVRLVAPSDTTSSYTLMDQADIGLVYTSTTGLELALSGTPTLVAGNTHYRAKGFTVDPDDGEAWRTACHAMLDDPAAFAPDVAMARRYASLFFFGAPVDFPFVTEPRLGLARITTTDARDLAPGRHDDLDRACEGILGLGDFGPRATEGTRGSSR